MIRSLIALSALAMTSAFAVPASADPSAVVSVAGKSPAQAYSAILAAARSLCRGAPLAGDIHGIYTNACIEDVVKTTLSHVDRSDLAHYARIN